MATIAPEHLKPGQRVRITQTVRVGKRSWPATVTGTIRDVQVLMTGLATQRAPDDIVAVPTVHFIKDGHGELSSITVDENTRVEVLDEKP
jgi:hypothetical protein